MRQDSAITALASDGLFGLSACDGAALIAKGAITSQALMEDCLGRIRDIDDGVVVWAFIDPDLALEQGLTP